MNIYDKLEAQQITDIDGEDTQTIETVLNLNHITKYNHDKTKLNSTMFDSWSDVVNFLADVEKINTSNYRDCTVYGYELVNDNHYIAIYYKHHTYNT